MRTDLAAAAAATCLAALWPSPAASQADCCRLADSALVSGFRVEAITHRRFTHEAFWRALTPYLGAGGVTASGIGRSLHGREIRAVDFGAGPTRVLLWSQMHGNESTATMALADIIRFFAEGGSDPLRERVRDALTVTMVPMLNPDGAERFQRHNAVGVDVNRDARRLATPEGRALKALRDSIAPDFGFNLHDQNARTTVGPGGPRAAIALLAPAAEETRAYGPVRARARQVAAVLAAALEGRIAGRIAKYDDTFTPRAFGDLMQAWGTSTVLIESGVLPDDPQKQTLRAVNAAAILTALDAIATGSYRAADIDRYESLPFNRGVANDLLLRGGWVVHPTNDPILLDFGLTYEDAVAGRGLRLGEVGDLEGAEAIDTVDVSGLYLHVTTQGNLDPADWWLTRGDPVSIVVRRGPALDSEVVFRLPP